jgi:hypothetical protein
MMITTNKYNLDLEITGGLIRIGPGLDSPKPWVFGSTDVAYTSTVDLVGSEGIAILKGLTQPFDHALHDAFDLLLRFHGFTHYARHRHCINKPNENLRIFPLRSLGKEKP